MGVLEVRMTPKLLLEKKGEGRIGGPFLAPIRA